MAFVDMRMPPGWDGLKTIEHLWAVDPDVQVVICSAHTDYDWSEVVDRLQHSDKLLVLRKPAEPIEVLQCATALTRKWQNERLVTGADGTARAGHHGAHDGAWRPPTGSCGIWPPTMP